MRTRVSVSMCVVLMYCDVRRAYVYMHVCMYESPYIYVYVYINELIYVYIYICICVCLKCVLCRLGVYVFICIDLTGCMRLLSVLARM